MLPGRHNGQTPALVDMGRPSRRHLVDQLIDPNASLPAIGAPARRPKKPIVLWNMTNARVLGASFSRTREGPTAHGPSSFRQGDVRKLIGDGFIPLDRGTCHCLSGAAAAWDGAAGVARRLALLRFQEGQRRSPRPPAVSNGIGRIETEKKPTHSHSCGAGSAYLQATLDAGPCGDLTFIVGKNDKPLTKEPFGNMFRHACKAAGVRDRRMGCGRSPRPGSE